MSEDNIEYPSEGPYGKSGFNQPTNENWAAKRVLADAVREMIAMVVTTNAPVAVLHEVADNMNQQLGLLRKHPRTYGRSKFEAQEQAEFGVLGYELNPLDGRSNPIAEGFDIWLTEDRAYGKVHVGWAYEGPPNCVHGGYVAALFDQFLGVAQKLTDQPGFTGTLKVRYSKPTPIDTDLHFEGWVEKIEGRKMVLKAELKVDNEVKASCEGLFISVTKAVVEALKNSR